MKCNRTAILLMPVLVVLVVFCMTGCVGGRKYDDAQAEKIVAKGRSALEDFAKTLPAKSVEIKSMELPEAAMEDSLIYAGSYLTNSVRMNFTADGKDYVAVIDLEKDVIYSDYYMFDLGKHIKRQLKPYCERYGFTGEYEVKWAALYEAIISHDVPDGDRKINTYVDICNMLPVSFNQEDETERADAFLKDAPVQTFRIEYRADDGSFFDPRILEDYLRETGNYKAPLTRSQIDTGIFKISGIMKEQRFSGGNLEAHYITLNCFDGADAIDYTWDCRKIFELKEFSICCRFHTEGPMDSWSGDTSEAFVCPVEEAENKLIYRETFGVSDIMLLSDKKPEYSGITRIRYIDLAPQEAEKLAAVQNDGGEWYLTLENNPESYKGYYCFDVAQDILLTR